MGFRNQQTSLGASSCCLSLSAEACGARPPKPYMSEPFAPWQINGHLSWPSANLWSAAWAKDFVDGVLPYSTRLEGEVFQAAWQWGLCQEGLQRRWDGGVCPQCFADEHWDAWHGLQAQSPTDFRHHPIPFLQDWLNPQVAKRRPGWAACWRITATLLRACGKGSFEAW